MEERPVREEHRHEAGEDDGQLSDRDRYGHGDRCEHEHEDRRSEHKRIGEEETSEKRRPVTARWELQSACGHRTIVADRKRCAADMDRIYIPPGIRMAIDAHRQG